MKNNHVYYNLKKERIDTSPIENREILPKNPLVEFYRDDVNNSYLVKILAFIPSSTEDIEIIAPEARNSEPTHIGIVDTRTIRIKVNNKVPLNPSETFNLWAISIDYTIIDPQEAIDQDSAIKVVYEYNEKDVDTGDIGPKLSRGTVTTTGTSPSQEL